MDPEMEIKKNINHRVTGERQILDAVKQAFEEIYGGEDTPF
jgi:hypothetical protein